MLTKDSIERLTALDLSCNVPAMQLRLTALELYNRLEALEEKIGWYFECKSTRAWHLGRTDLSCIWRDPITENQYCPYCQALDEIDESYWQAERSLREVN